VAVINQNIDPLIDPCINEALRDNNNNRSWVEHHEPGINTKPDTSALDWKKLLTETPKNRIIDSQQTMHARIDSYMFNILSPPCIDDVVEDNLHGLAQTHLITNKATLTTTASLSEHPKNTKELIEIRIEFHTQYINIEARVSSIIITVLG
ncbi:hypothetical protein ACJ72_08307, partial [Emergomyces africanus]